MPDTMAIKSGMTPAKKTVFDWVDSNLQRLSDDHMTIWSYHEPAWREYRSARWYVERLRAEGFTVEEGSGEMPTAFCATWSHAPGHTIGGSAAYAPHPGFL